MATLVEDRPALRLATDDGATVEGRPRPVRFLSDEEGEDALLDFLATLGPQLDPCGNFRVETLLIVARLEQRLARRGT